MTVKLRKQSLRCAADNGGFQLAIDTDSGRSCYIVWPKAALLKTIANTIIVVSAPNVVAALEKRIRQHAQQKIIPATRKAAAEHPVRRFEETVPTALQFLVDPYICGSLGRWRHTE